MDLVSTGGVAAVGAIVSTVPIGPINIWLISLCWSKRHQQWWAVTLGVVVVDITVSLAACFFADTVQQLFEGDVHWVVSVPARNALFGAVMLVMAVLLLGSEKDRSAQDPAPQWQARGTALGGVRGFAFGALATLAEPGLFIFWSAWWLEFSPGLSAENIAFPFVMTLGIGIGDGLVFGFYRLAANRTERVFAPSTILFIRRMVAAGLIALAMIFEARALKGILHE